MRNPFKRKVSEQMESVIASEKDGNVHDQIESSDLPIALYLNQRLTFDLLASLEDGFSHVINIQTTSAGASSTELSGEGKLGFSNVFALVGIEFGGRGARSGRSGQSHSESTTEQIVHTPTSLFARLRKELHQLGMVQKVSGASSLSNISHSDFVEFEATLKRNPLDEMFSMFSSMAPLIDLTDQPSPGDPQGSNRRKGTRQQHRKNDSSMKQQVESIYSAFKNDKSQDFIAELGEVNVVLTTDQAYFIDPTMNDVIDGQFRVFGKTTRVLPNGGDDTINLLRRTPFGKFIHQVPDFQDAFSEFEKLGLGSMEPEIQGPAMQVIPIAIFS